MSYRKVTVNTNNLIMLSNGKIDWKKSIGLDLCYKIEGTDFSGIIKLVDVDGKNLLISIDNKPEIKIGKESLRKGSIAKQLGTKAKIFKFNAGDVINNQKIIDQIIIQHYSIPKNGEKVISHENGYIVECLKDHYQYEILEKSLVHERGCPICGKNKVVPGINDIATTNPKLAEWFVDKSLTFKLSKDTNQKVELKCPICGRYFVGIPNHFKKGYPSCVCQKSSLSYPEKIFSSILNQLNIDYIFQLSKTTFQWCKSYKYDFYFEIESNKYIVELDGGLGHGKKAYNDDSFFIDDSIKRDKEKDELALEHGIKLIRIDVDYPDVRYRFQFIYNNIILSDLNTILNFNMVDLQKCEIDAENSLIVIIGKMWDEDHLTLSEIKQKLQIGETTISNYLKKGKELGLNNYIPHSRKYVPDHIKKIIKVIDTNNEIICVHRGISDFQKNSKSLINKYVDNSTIYHSLKSNRPSSGYLFSYATEEELQNFINNQNK